MSAPALAAGWLARAARAGLVQPYPRAEDAYAVADDVAQQLAEQRERGSWYRVTAAKVRQAIGNRSAAQAPREAAAARLQAPAAEAEASRQRGATQVEAGEQLGVDQRTIRRWTKLRGYEAELAKARARQEGAAQRAQKRARKRR